MEFGREIVLGIEIRILGIFRISYFSVPIIYHVKYNLLFFKMTTSIFGTEFRLSDFFFFYNLFDRVLKLKID